MGNLEHNIKEAFETQDTKTKLADKNAIWNRLENKMHSREGVAAFWRVAAIFIGLLLFTGVFAALNSRAKQNDKLEKLVIENGRLSATIDSLLVLPLSTKTEVKIVEKEKIVYRDRIVTLPSTNSEKFWEKKYHHLSDSTAMVLSHIEKNYNDEVEQLNSELASAKDKLEHFSNDTDKTKDGKHAAPFELKSERINVGVSDKPSVKNPEMEMKVFQRNFIENRNNLNRTIFKK